MGFLLADLDRRADAAVTLRRALTLSPGDLDVRLRLGAVELARGRNDEAIAAYDYALEHSKEPIADAFLGRGIARARLTPPKLDLAEADLTRAAELAKDSAAPHYNLGWLREDLRKDPAAAEASYREALRRNDSHVEATIRLGGILEARHDDAAALAMYQKALTLPIAPWLRAPLRDRVDALTKSTNNSNATNSPNATNPAQPTNPESKPASSPDR
jgi:tetratricopeptide (TPR) repeat protein